MSAVREPASPRRRRTRAARTRRYLDAAMAIVGAEGLDALTMARLADELDVAVGSAYRYFPSKDALVAALQRDAIETLLGAYRESRADLDAAIGRRPDGVARVLAGAVHFGAFLADAVTGLPEESRLLLLLVSDPRPVVPEDQVAVAAPAAAELLGVVAGLLRDGAAAGALVRGDARDRAVEWLAGLSGVLASAKLARLDAGLPDVPSLAGRLTGDLLVAWGADPAAVRRAAGLVARLAAVAPLARPPSGDPLGP